MKFTTKKAIGEEVRLETDPREEFSALRAGLRIDRNSLDDNMIEQPVFYQQVSEEHVMACGERDAAKEQLAGIDAKLAQAIRNKWAAEGDKVNETKVGDAVQMSEEHLAAHANWSRLARRAAYLAALKESYDQRSKMLRELASLYVVGYFSRASTNAGSKEVEQARASAAREALRKARVERN